MPNQHSVLQLASRHFQLGEGPNRGLLIVKTSPMVRGTSNSCDVQVMCGGTLVNEDTVITAAHCFDPIPGGAGINMARLGDHDITTSSDGGSPQDISIARTIQHPAWDSHTLDSDIAIVKLSRPVSFTRRIR